MPTAFVISLWLGSALLAGGGWFWLRSRSRFRRSEAIAAGALLGTGAWMLEVMLLAPLFGN